jgi:deazaflavin-dependent oxidoreductase (nitroreductase family)
MSVRPVDRVYMALHRVFMPRWRRRNALDRLIVRAWTRFDTWFYRRFGWSASGRMMHVDVLLLRTTGRRTGRVRDAMVACLDGDGSSLIIGGGNWGWDHDPGWYYNLAANPDVEVVRGRQTVPMRATVLAGAEAETARDALATAYPHSQLYVNRRTRPVPVVRLDPGGDQRQA